MLEVHSSILANFSFYIPTLVGIRS
jgi:hypothetical protein